MDSNNRFSFSQSLGSLKEEHEAEIKQNEANLNLQSEIGNSAKFESLIDMVVTSFAEVQGTIQDLLQLKDDLLLSYLPPPLLFKIAIVFGNAYRTFSDLNTPVFELLRLVKIFSVSWEKNSAILKKIHDMYEQKKQLLNIAIKRLALVEKKTKLFSRERRIMNWEKLFIKLSEAKGHGRRWKFQIETLRKKADQGYDELLRWVLKDGEDAEEQNEEDEENEDIEGLPVPKKRNGKNRGKSRELSREMVREKTQELKREKFSDNPFDLESNFFNGEEKIRKNENYMVEVDSDQDLFSEDSFRASPNRKGKNKTSKIKTEDKTIQTEPKREEKTTWTGEPIYQRSFIVRIFKPQELNTKKLKFKITLGNCTFTSKSFENKPEKKVKIVESADKKSKSKKPNDGAEAEKNNEKKLDLSKYEDFLFEINDYHNKKDILATDTESCLKFEVNSDTDKEGPIGFSNIQMDDIHSLDLPILYYKNTNECQVVDFYEPGDNQKAQDDSLAWLRLKDFTEDSVENYELLSRRTPFFFDVFKNSTARSSESVCKLPLMFFWTRKPVIAKLDKNTGSQSLKDIVENLTGFDIEKTNIIEIQNKLTSAMTIINKDVRDDTCSPMPIVKPPTPLHRPKTAPSPVPKKSDFTQVSKDNFNNNEIQEMQDNYQLKIDELNLIIYNLENELAQQKSLNDLKAESIRNERSRNKVSSDKIEKFKKSKSQDKLGQDRSNFNDSQKNLQTQFRPYSPSWNKELADNFLERLKLFNEKSSAHHKEIIDKYMLEESNIREQQMAVQHRLDSQNRNSQKFDDFCLPAVFMPFRSGNNVFNPKAHQYFHPTGSHDLRLTQPPTIFQLPPLPSKTAVSVINLFDLSKRYQSGQSDFYISDYIKKNYNSPSKMVKTESSDLILRETNESNIDEIFKSEKNNDELYLDENDFKAS